MGTGLTGGCSGSAMELLGRHCSRSAGTVDAGLVQMSGFPGDT